MTDKSFKVKANEFEFLFSSSEADHADVIKTGEGDYNIIRNGRSINVKLLEADQTGKYLKVEVEGELYSMQIKDKLDQTLDNMGFNNVSTKQVKEIKAPMPGLVLEVSVEVGQELVEGDRVLILEAMKMENSICIHANARIKNILVNKGQAVDKNQILVELE